MTGNELLTSGQVAQEMGVTDRTVLRWIERDYFPNAFKAGWTWRIPRSDLTEYIAKQKRKRQAEA